MAARIHVIKFRCYNIWVKSPISCTEIIGSYPTRVNWYGNWVISISIFPNPIFARHNEPWLKAVWVSSVRFTLGIRAIEQEIEKVKVVSIFHYYVRRNMPEGFRWIFGFPQNRVSPKSGCLWFQFFWWDLLIADSGGGACLPRPFFYKSDSNWKLAPFKVHVSSRTAAGIQIGFSDSGDRQQQWKLETFQ